MPSKPNRILWSAYMEFLCELPLRNTLRLVKMTSVVRFIGLAIVIVHLSMKTHYGFLDCGRRNSKQSSPRRGTVLRF